MKNIDCLENTVEQQDIVEVFLDNDELKLAYQMAKKAEIGGKSRFRNDNDRQANLTIDQFIGVGLGELAGNKHFFSVKDYYNSRIKKNENPYSGDNGSDTLGYKIDYKASHAKNPNLLNYNLVVRPKELHSGFVYILILIRSHGLSPQSLITGETKPKIYLMGWADYEMLKDKQVTSGIFGPKNGNGGAHVIQANKLLKIKDLTTIPQI